MFIAVVDPVTRISFLFARCRCSYSYCDSTDADLRACLWRVKVPLTTTKKVKNLQTAGYNMQQATCIAAAIKLAGKWAAPKGRHALDACRSVQRSNRPGLAPAIVRQAFVTRQAVVSLVRWRRRSAADDHWRELWIFIDWTARCDWLQVVSYNIVPSLAGLFVSFIIVLRAV